MLDRLLRPRSIAVIGGGFWGANVVEQCAKIGFTGDVWRVHPTLEGAFRSVGDLPAAPDAAFIGVNRDATIDAVRALSARGAGGAVCFAAGFREAVAQLGDGADKQTALLDAAGDMPILGPNCYGFLNYLDGAALWPDQHGGIRVDRGVALVTQSSNIAINLTMQARGLPLAYVVTVGNQAQVGISAISTALLQDDRVTALGLYIEGIDDLRAFEALATTARALGKPIVALKTGASDQAQVAAISHTASLAGSAAGAEALLRRLGIGQARSLPVLLETLKLLHVAGPLPSNRIASMSCSGGEASLMADSALGTGADFPPLVPAQTAPLQNALGAKVALANPLDYNTYIWGDLDAMTATYTAMMQGDLAIGCVVVDFPRADRCDPSAWEPVITAVANTQAATGRPMALLATLPETMPEDMATRLATLGIVPFCGVDEALAAIAIAATLGPPSTAPLLLPPTNAGEVTTHLEARAKSLLADHGLSIPGSGQAHGPNEAARLADTLGYPVALKGQGVAHKTEAGAVALNLKTRQAVIDAATAMPTADLLVEQQVTGVVAELLIGVIADPAHGYVLTLGAGGTATEILQDTASLLLPVAEPDIRQALASLRMAPLLSGYRGAPAADTQAIVDAVLAVQTYVTHAKPLEVEVNPLMCTPSAAYAVDALIRIGKPE